ncbi:AlpA family phage regulatory protein [Shewanella algae]|uniref:AlpA family phage regulatory protein n=1 Tax=Shewanella algae TaxID=38313 RepID=UPI0028C3A38B|nr:AlpA family phage regulatory protein [Shewanella algae]
MLLKKVSELTGLGRSSIYNYMTEGRFPKSFKLGHPLGGLVRGTGAGLDCCKESGMVEI